MPIQNHPVNEVETLVHLLGSIRAIRPQIRHRTRPELNLVLRYVKINQQAVPPGKRSTNANDNVHLRRFIRNNGPKPVHIEKVLY